FLYSLSPHDALPIFSGSPPIREGHAPGARLLEVSEGVVREEPGAEIDEVHRWLLVRDVPGPQRQLAGAGLAERHVGERQLQVEEDRKSTRLNSSHVK